MSQIKFDLDLKQKTIDFLKNKKKTQKGLGALVKLKKKIGEQK